MITVPDDEWLPLIEKFANRNGLSNSEASFILNEFDCDEAQAQFHLESRYRPAAAEWEGLQVGFGFRQPFPIRIPLPCGNRVYHKLRSITLSRNGDMIRLSCSTEYLGKPGTWHDGATCSFTHDFQYLPELKNLTDIFEYWVSEQRVFHSERLAATNVRSHLQDENFFYNPDSWTLQGFINNKGATLRKCGVGACLTLNVGCLGCYGTSTSIYLLSSEGSHGTIVTENAWPFVDFDVEKFVIGQPDDLTCLPVLDDTAFEFANQPHL